MNEEKLRTLAQLQEFLNATQKIDFRCVRGDSDRQHYEHICRAFRRLVYSELGKFDGHT